MVHLNLGTTYSQPFFLTLEEELPCDTDCFKAVFVIENQLTFETITFSSVDTASYPGRYNRFDVYVVDNPLDQDLLTSRIYLTQSDVGMWKYTVWNQPCSVPDIDPSEFINVLEKGYLKITCNNETI